MFITQEFATNCFDNYEEFIFKIYAYSEAKCLICITLWYRGLFIQSIHELL